MNKRILIAALLVGALVSAFGFVHSRTSGNPRHWDLLTGNVNVHTNVVNRNTRAIRYFLAADAFSTTNTAAELNAVRATFAQWQSISGTYLNFEDAGTTATSIDVNTSDNRNLIYWAKTNSLVNGGLNDLNGALGVTFQSFFADGTYAEADIVFNGYTNINRYTNAWFTDFNDANNTNFFIEAVAAHEIGHFVGLAHSPIGGATMLFAGPAGVNLQAGLSSDEVAAARFIYGATNQVNTHATLKGQITKNGVGIVGAAIFVEDSATNIIGATVSRTGGTYEMNALLPGAYQVRVSPLDAVGGFSLVRGPDISSEFNAADPNFLPSGISNVTLTAGVTNTFNVAVVGSTPAFRITHTRAPTVNPNSFGWGATPRTLSRGTNNLIIGVASLNLPTSGATLAISGDGLTVGPTVLEPNAVGNGLNFISVTVSVATNATPGLRTFTVRQGTNVAHANGFLEILPPVPDYNFDGFDDVFQRKWFPLFTVTNAAPAADPDNDGFPNSAENIAGTNPTNAASILKIDSIKQDVTGATVSWRSVPGRSYQLLFRSPVTAAGWTPVGAPLLASTSTTNKLDPNGTSTNRFYRVQVLP